MKLYVPVTASRQVDQEQLTRSRSGLWLPTNAEASQPAPIGVDLFAGAGGFSCGMKQGGFHVAAACEHDYWAMQTYLLNLGGPRTKIVTLDDDARATIDKAIKKGWAVRGKRSLTEGHPLERQPDGTYRAPEAGSAWLATTNHAPCEVYYFGDVRNLTGTQILQDLGLPAGALHCIFGGPPCQGFSAAGKRNVMDPRNSLIFEFARLVVETSPMTFVLENVTGLASMVTPEGLNVIDAFCLALSRGGYANYEALKRSMGVTPTGRAGARGNRGSVAHGQSGDHQEVEDEAELSTRQASLFDEVLV